MIPLITHVSGACIIEPSVEEQPLDHTPSQAGLYYRSNPNTYSTMICNWDVLCVAKDTSKPPNYVVLCVSEETGDDAQFRYAKVISIHVPSAIDEELLPVSEKIFRQKINEPTGDWVICNGGIIEGV